MPAGHRPLAQRSSECGAWDSAPACCEGERTYCLSDGCHLDEGMTGDSIEEEPTSEGVAHERISGEDCERPRALGEHVRPSHFQGKATRTLPGCPATFVYLPRHVTRAEATIRVVHSFVIADASTKNSPRACVAYRDRHVVHPCTVVLQYSAPRPGLAMRLVNPISPLSRTERGLSAPTSADWRHSVQRNACRASIGPFHMFVWREHFQAPRDRRRACPGHKSPKTIRVSPI